MNKRAGTHPMVAGAWVAAWAMAVAVPTLAQQTEYTLEGTTWVEKKTPAPAPEAEVDPLGVEPEAPAPLTDEQTIAEVRRLLAEGDPRRAKNLLDPWIEANDRGSSPYLAEAYLLRGDSLLAQGMEYLSLYDYEAVARRFPQSEAFPLANQREFDIALAYANGKKRRIAGLRIWDASDIAVELLIRVQERMPGSELAERAAIELADFYYRTREIELAAEAYALYVENHPRGPNRMKAEQRRIYCDIARFKGPRYDASGLLDAQVRIRNFQNRYQAEAEQSGLNEGLIARLDESLAAQMLESAEWYLLRRDEPSARLILRRLVREQPGTLAAQRGLAMLEQRGWLEAPTEPAPAATQPTITIEGPQRAQPIAPESAPGVSPGTPPGTSPDPVPPAETTP